MPPWFDTHVHLDRYDPAEQAALLTRAGDADVCVIVVADNLERSRHFEAVPGLAGYLVGVHPLRATTEPLRKALARDALVVGIGECGFDGAAGNLRAQAPVFRAQCVLARELELPLVLHVDGEAAWSALFMEAAAMDGLTVVRHYFTGGPEQALWHAARGHYVSFGNPLRRSPELQEVARNYPADRLLIETDSYPLPGRTTEPRDVARIGEALATLRGWKHGEAKERLAANTAAAFPKLLAG